MRFSLLIFVLLILFSCSESAGNAIHGHLLQLRMDSELWIERMESELKADSKNSDELKRAFFGLTLKTTHLYRECHMIINQFDLDMDLEIIEMRKTLEKKSQLTTWFYDCSDREITNQELKDLIIVEKEIHGWLGELMKRVDEE